MLDSRGGRLLGVVVLLGLLFGAMVWYGTVEPSPALGAYPSHDEVERGVVDAGDAVVVSGRVVETDPLVVDKTVHLVVDGAYEKRTLRVTVVGTDRSYEVGQTVQVFGTYAGDRTVRASNAVTAGSRSYAYAVSFLAGLWVLGRLAAGWRVDLGTLALRRRERHRGVVALLRDALPGGGDR